MFFWVCSCLHWWALMRDCRSCDNPEIYLNCLLRKNEASLIHLDRIRADAADTEEVRWFCAWHSAPELSWFSSAGRLGQNGCLWCCSRSCTAVSPPWRWSTWWARLQTPCWRRRPCRPWTPQLSSQSPSPPSSSQPPPSDPQGCCDLECQSPSPPADPCCLDKATRHWHALPCFPLMSCHTISVCNSQIVKWKLLQVVSARKYLHNHQKIFDWKSFFLELIIQRKIEKILFPRVSNSRFSFFFQNVKVFVYRAILKFCIWHRVIVLNMPQMPQCLCIRHIFLFSSTLFYNLRIVLWQEYTSIFILNFLRCLA